MNSIARNKPKMDSTIYNALRNSLLHQNKFSIDIENCVFRQLEIGVNINPPINTKQVLKACLKYKTNDIKWVYTRDEGNYIQATNQRHFIKI